MRSNTIAVGLGLSVIAFLFLWQQLQATRLGYEVESARSQLRQQRDRNAYLRLELARLHSPDRIAKEARERLHMAPANPECLIFLGSAVQRPDEPQFLSLLIRPH